MAPKLGLLERIDLAAPRQKLNIVSVLTHLSAP
jgi:hypothetical protein